MLWARMLAYVTGRVNQELLLRNEYLGAEWNSTVRVWSVATRQPVGEPLECHGDIVETVVFSPDGKTLASGNADNTVWLWDVASRQPLGEPLKGHSDAVRSVAFSPDGKMLVFSQLGQNGSAMDRGPILMGLTKV
jgi:WD40 repeat protein